MPSVKISELQFEEREGYERAVVFSNDDFGAPTKLQVMRLAPGQSIKPHHHNVRTECFRIISGVGEIIINDEVVARTLDDITLCRPGDVHEFINKSSSEPFLFQVVRTNDPVENDMFWEDK